MQCKECNGKGEITLFTSVETCTQCNGSREAAVYEPMHGPMRQDAGVRRVRQDAERKYDPTTLEFIPHDAQADAIKEANLWKYKFPVSSALKVVGEAKCEGEPVRMRFIGFMDERKLFGKTALVRKLMEDPNHSMVGAQFDDMSTGLGLGWHTFYKDQFEEIKTITVRYRVT